jgi:hypothetical protein
MCPNTHGDFSIQAAVIAHADLNPRPQINAPALPLIQISYALPWVPDHPIEAAR